MCRSAIGPSRDDAAARYPTRHGSIRISRAQVASTAGRFVPITSTPDRRGVPMIGPSPSMPTMPSTIARCGRTAALMSRIDGPMPGVMQHVLGPPVHDPRHHAEEVLHRQRDPRPVVRLHLGQRHDQVRTLERCRQGQPRQRRLPQPIRNELHVVVIQVDELQARFVQDLAQPRLVENEQGVAAVPRPLGHQDTRRTPAPKDLGRRTNDVRVRVDLGASRLGSTRFGFSSTVLPLAHAGPARARASPTAIVRSRSAS